MYYGIILLYIKQFIFPILNNNNIINIYMEIFDPR